MLRRIAAIVAGLLVLALVVSLVQRAVGVMHPLPDGTDPGSGSVDFQAWVAHLPPAAWVLGFCSEIGGALLGAFTAGFIVRDGRRGVASVVVAASLAASMLKWNTFAHPAWFIVGQLVAYPLVLLAAFAALGGKPRRERIPAPIH